jgi:hypothetical protein
MHILPSQHCFWGRYDTEAPYYGAYAATPQRWQAALIFLLSIQGT